MADPLVLLQEYAMGKRELRKVKHNDKLYYVFGDIAYPHDAKTNLGVYNKQNEYYTIESILLFWKMRELQHTAYVRDVSGRGIASITRVQRRDLLDFLLGGQLPKEANMMAPIPPSILATHLQPEDESQQQQQHEPQKKKPKLDQRQQDEKGQRIDKILDKSIGGGDKDDVASAEVVRGLSSALPAEKVAQLRNRVKSNLKNKPSHVAITSSETSTMTGVAAGKDGISHYIQEKERIRKDRTTCLESPSRDFSSILALLKDIHMRENQAKSIHHDHLGSAQPGVASAIPSVGSASQASVKSGQKPPMPGGYSRYDQEIFQRDTMADFVIDTDLSFHGNNTLNQMKNQQAVHLSTSSSSFPLPPPLILPQQSSSVSNGVHSSTGRTDQRQNAGSSMNSGAGQQRPSKRVSRTPIIVIPATGTALITMYNAQDILQDLRFVSSEEKKRFYRRENELLLQINKNGAAVPYRVIDNPTKLKDEEWDRVVAVFVQGPAWQFKGWKWNGNPVEIFANVAAFHLKFEEQKLDPNVAKWSVNVLSLSRTKRHLDRAILQKFWEILDRHISKSSKREWLRY